MAIQQAIEALRLDYTSTGADKMAADAQKVAAAQDNAAVSATKYATAQDGVVVAEQKTQRVRQSTETQLMRLQRQVDAQMRKQMEQARIEALLHRSVAEGLITDQRRIELMKLATQHLDRQTAAVNRAAAASRGLAGANDNTRFATANLAAQFQDIAVTAQMGMSPIQIALQQGTQLSAVLNTMQSPIRGLAGALASVINPVSLLTIGFVALGAAAVQWFTSAKDGAEDAETALERHRKWLDDLLRGYGDLAKAARAAGEAAAALPQGIVEIELARGIQAQEAERARINAEIAAARAEIRTLVSELSSPSAPLAFRMNRDELEALRDQFAMLRNIALDAKSTKQELEAAGRAAAGIASSAESQVVKDMADAYYRLTLQIIELGARSAETEAAMKGLRPESWSGASFAGVADAIERVKKQVVDLRTEKQRLDDAFRTDAMGARTLSEIYALAEAYDRLNASLAARDARQRAEELKSALDDLDRRAREVTYAGLSDRHAATNRILDEFEERAATLRRLGASEDDLARNTRVMNEAIRQSAAHFDELERKAGEKGAAKAIKEVNREMERFIARSNQMIDSFFPGEAALREARELEALLARFGGHLDHIQRAAVEMRIADMFTAASLGVRELDRESRSTQATMGDLVDLAVQFGQQMGSAFSEPLREGERFFDRIARLIGDLGRMLMETFKVDWKKTLGLDGGANSPARAAEQAAKAISAVTLPSASSPVGGAAAASGLQGYTVAIQSLDSTIRYSNQHAVRSQRLSDRLTSVLQQAASAVGVGIEVMSGGQPSGGPNRVGSHRHDNGNAADIYLTQGGVRLNWAKEDQREIISQFITQAVAGGATGIGAGRGYMAEGMLHVGFGGAGVWGAGGKGANAEQWVRQAWQAGMSGTPVAANQNTQVQIAAAVPASGTGGIASTPAGIGKAGQSALAALGAAAAGFSSGYQAQDPFMGAISGALGGLGSGNIIGVAAGLIGGLIGGFIGLQKAIREAQEKLKSMATEIDNFVAAGTGEGFSAIRKTLSDYNQQAHEYIKLASQARDPETVKRIVNAQVSFYEQMSSDFKAGFEGILHSLSSGQGLTGAFVDAQNSILDLREELKAFIADTSYIYGAASEQVERAKSASREYLVTLLGVTDELSEVQSKLESLEGVASVMKATLEDLGMSGAEAAAVMRSELIESIEKLRSGLLDDINRSILSLYDKDHINEMADAVAKYNERIKDMKALGLSASNAQLELALSLGNIAANANLSAEELEKFGIAAGLSGEMIAQATEALSIAQARSAIDEHYSLVNSLLDVWKNFVDGINEYITDLNLNESLSTLSASEQLAEAKSEYERVLSLAMSGDQEAMGDVQGAASAYLEKAASFWASGEEYAAIFRDVKSGLSAVKDEAASQVTAAEQSLVEARSQIGWLAEQNNNLVSLNQATIDLRAAIDAYLGEGGSFSGTVVSAMVDLIGAAQQQVTATNAVASSIQLVSQSVQAVADALLVSAAQKSSGGSGGLSAQDQANLEALSPGLYSILKGNADAYGAAQAEFNSRGAFQKFVDWISGRSDWEAWLRNWASNNGFALGGAFLKGMQITPFATGGLVNSPTMFPMANGMGLMGEAGPEAIMPLTRMPDGRLGVSMAMPSVSRQMIPSQQWSPRGPVNDNSEIVSELRNNYRALASGFNAMIEQQKTTNAELEELRGENARLRKDIAFLRAAA